MGIQQCGVWSLLSRERGTQWLRDSGGGAAAIFEDKADNLSLAAKILNAMSADDRGAIMGVMDAEVAAKLAKIMDPD